MIPDYISELRLSVQKPLIVEIPDRHGGRGAGAVLSKYLADAVGIKIEG